MTKETTDELILGPLGVSEVGERVYRDLLLHPASSLRDLAGRVEVSTRLVHEVLGQLQSLGLVNRVGDTSPRFVALAAHLVVESLFSQRKAELERARALGSKLDEQVGLNERDPSLFEIVTIIEGRRAMQQHCRHLHAHAREEILVFERPPYGVPTHTNEPELEALARGVKCRTIYEPEALEFGNHPELIPQQIEAGESARVYARLPMWMMITDSRTGVVPLRQALQAEGGAVLIHSSWLLNALRTLFETIWDRAVPLPAWSVDVTDDAKSEPLSDRDRHILTMLAGGVKDEAIARQLNVDPATVRRRIRKLARSLGVDTRFQVGVMATRKGWL